MRPLFPGSYRLKFATALGTLAAVGLGTVLWLDVRAENTGYRGTGMVWLETEEEEREERLLNANWAEEVYTEDPYVPEEGYTPASEVYQNVQVLGDLSVDNFNRLMNAITQWVSPEQGCAYCHGEDGNFAADDLYTKIVSRRMLQITRNINANWPEHVYPTGVNCYTCHRGQPVPQHIWFESQTPRLGMSFGAQVAQNTPNAFANYSSLPTDAFDVYLAGYDRDVKVQNQVPITSEFDETIKAAEHTYALMMHYSGALDVNCTYCHNTRAFYSWEQSTPIRARALAGQQMTREVNVDYLIPLASTYPDNRLGPTGDAPKANCLTCHYGQSKPMGGFSVIDDWPELATEQGPPDYTQAANSDPEAAADGEAASQESSGQQQEEGTATQSQEGSGGAEGSETQPQ